jgi:hypothetical protein
MNIANTDWSNLKFALWRLHDDSEIANISWFDDILQIYFIFARFCKFQKLFDKIKAKELLPNKGVKAPTLTKVSLF